MVTIWVALKKENGCMGKRVKAGRLTPVLVLGRGRGDLIQDGIIEIEVGGIRVHCER